LKLLDRSNDVEEKTNVLGNTVAVTLCKKFGRISMVVHRTGVVAIETVKSAEGRGSTSNVNRVSELVLAAEYSAMEVTEEVSTILLQHKVVAATFDPCTVSRGIKCVAKSSV